MKKFAFNILIIGFLAGPFLGVSYFILSLSITAVIFLRNLILFSRTSIILDIISLYSCILYLVGPYLSYNFFNASFQQAVIFDFVMPIDANTYYAFAFPAIVFFVLGLNLFRLKYEKKYLEYTIYQFKNNFNPSLILPFVFLSVPAFYLLKFMPSALFYIDMLIYLMVFPAIIMLAFKKPKSLMDKSILWIICLWILYTGIKATMFTIVFYMGVTMVAVLFIGRNYRFIVKGIVTIVFLFLTISLQFTKSNFRSLIKSNVEIDLSVSRFADVYFKNLMNSGEIFDIGNAFPLTLRFNNGYYLALVMERIPKRKDFDHGEVLGLKILSTLVPRLFWPSKPEAGGIYNMKYYADIEVRHTVNVGPIGEAYGSFGVTGGILFMFLFGLVLGFAHNKFVLLAYKTPMLFMWMPVVFYESLYCMENDTMQSLNSLIKISVFLFIVFRLFPSLLRPRQEPALNLAV